MLVINVRKPTWTPDIKRVGTKRDAGFHLEGRETHETRTNTFHLVHFEENLIQQFEV